jgi:hypothetical protein
MSLTEYTIDTFHCSTCVQHVSSQRECFHGRSVSVAMLLLARRSRLKFTYCSPTTGCPPWSTKVRAWHSFLLVVLVLAPPIRHVSIRCGDSPSDLGDNGLPEMDDFSIRAFLCNAFEKTIVAITYTSRSWNYGLQDVQRHGASFSFAHFVFLRLRTRQLIISERFGLHWRLD